MYYYLATTTVLVLLAAALVLALTRVGWPGRGLLVASLTSFLTSRGLYLLARILTDPDTYSARSSLLTTLRTLGQIVDVAGIVLLLLYVMVPKRAVDVGDTPQGATPAQGTRAVRDSHYQVDLPSKDRVSVLRRRYGAYFIDAFAINVPCIAVLMFWAAALESSRGRVSFTMASVTIAALVVSIAALTYFLSRDGFSGQGLGKKITGVRVVDLAIGHPIGPLQSAARNWIYAIPLAPIVELIVANVRSDSRRLGDLMAGTTVVWADNRSAQAAATLNVVLAPPTQSLAAVPSADAQVASNAAPKHHHASAAPEFIQVDCPGCGHHLKAPAKFAGRKAKCKCGQALLVPMS